MSPKLLRASPVKNAAGTLRSFFILLSCCSEVMVTRQSHDSFSGAIAVQSETWLVEVEA